MMSSRLRIVLDARATTAHFPGIARATLGLLQGLHRCDHPHHIAVVSLPEAPPGDDPIWRDPRFERVVADVAPLGLRQQWLGPWLARRLHADLWHAPYYLRPFWGLPRPVVTVFDVIGHLLPEALPTLQARLLFEASMRLSLRTAQQIITCSAASRRDLETIYHVPTTRISVIPLAVDPAFAPRPAREIAALRERYHLPARYVLYLGSNKPHKNLAALVRAWQHVDSDALLVIAGHWDRRYATPRLLAHQLGLAQRIRFLPDPPDADLPALLSGASVFVFPSRYEGFGLPPLEAMACGTAVVAANTSSLPEVVGEGGLLVAPEPAALAAALQRVLDDADLRATLQARGLARARQFTWTRTARATLALYETVGG